jgi:single-strand DNA-binding protein
LHKGSSVFVEGRLQSRSWEDTAGAKRSVIEVRAERVQFMGAPGQAKITSPATSAQPEVLAEESSSESTWLAESEDETHEG